MDEQDFLRKVGENIKQIRKNKGLSQVDLAFLCEMEKTYLNPIEKGKINPTALTYLKIAKALEVDVKMFFDFDTVE
ncbi:MAG: helix-turn-helix transcriptional regulator [Bacteroidetes bacterium]|nr:helix-turn-helix transcriptional regulator [Bacteroidota bacterium]